MSRLLEPMGPHRAIDVNTQVRRLAYETAAVRLLDNLATNEELLLLRLVEWSRTNSSNLEQYISKAGRITETKSSGKRYIDFAYRLSLLTKVLGACHITRFGRLLSYITRERTNSSSNPFTLTDQERLFYLFLLIYRDADYFLTVMDLVKSEEGQPIGKLQRLFQSAYVQRLSQRIEGATDVHAQRALVERRNKVQTTWKKPETYAEHIVPPRLNWMLDLQILDAASLARNSCALTNQGKDLVATLPNGKSRVGALDAPVEWLEDSFFTASASTLLDRPLTVGSDVAGTEMANTVEKVLEDTYVWFAGRDQRVAPLDVCLLAVTIRLAAESHTAINFIDLVSLLGDRGINGRLGFEAKVLPRHNESFLTRR